MSLDHHLTHRRGRTKNAGGAGFTKNAGGAGRTKRAPGAGRARAALSRTRGLLRLRVLAAAVAIAALLAGGWLWLRDSSFVRVTRVNVTGVTSSAEPKIDAALVAAARDMTTMHVHQDVLRRAVAGFPSVAGISVSTDFPHGMTIEVLERRPAAALVAGDVRVAVTGDGRLLRDVQDTMGLPTIAQRLLPAGDRVGAARTLAQLAVAAAAPPELRRRAEDVSYGDEGLEVDLADGPPLIFGTADRATAKWTAAARVLSDPSAAGATYLDLRVPGRVAAGGLAPVVAEDPQGDAVDPTASPTPTPVPSAVPTATPTVTPYTQP